MSAFTASSFTNWRPEATYGPSMPGTPISFEFATGQWQDAQVISQAATNERPGPFQVQFYTSYSGRVAVQTLHYPDPSEECPKRWKIPPKHPASSYYCQHQAQPRGQKRNSWLRVVSATGEYGYSLIQALLSVS